jgi:hypothetical protein
MVSPPPAASGTSFAVAQSFALRLLALKRKTREILLSLKIMISI